MYLMKLLLNGKMARERHARKKVIIGTTIGVTIGTIIGILLAPKAGKDTRGDIMNNIQELPNKAKELSAKTQEMIAGVKDKIVAETPKIVDEAKEQIGYLKKDLHEDSRFKKPTDIAEEQINAFKEKLK